MHKLAGLESPAVDAIYRQATNMRRFSEGAGHVTPQLKVPASALLAFGYAGDLPYSEREAVIQALAELKIVLAKLDGTFVQPVSDANRQAAN